MRFQRARCRTIGAFHQSDATVQKPLEFDGNHPRKRAFGRFGGSRCLPQHRGWSQGRFEQRKPAPPFRDVLFEPASPSQADRHLKRRVVLPSHSHALVSRTPMEGLARLHQSSEKKDEIVLSRIVYQCMNRLLYSFRLYRRVRKNLAGQKSHIGRLRPALLQQGEIGLMVVEKAFQLFAVTTADFLSRLSTALRWDLL
jgi:hypothetical protein